ncbi:MAG: sugar-binding domain-containing protein [Mangrovibacterium sp.]
METKFIMKKQGLINCLLAIVLSSSVACSRSQELQIDLTGEWNFQIDSLDCGVNEKWYEQSLAETVSLPGTMAQNGKGNEISVATPWTGLIVDKTWYTEDKYARYRQDGNVKIPFWLQPDLHYIGAAWYQKQVEIPADWSGKAIELTLERPHWETQVWVNNQRAGMQNSLGTAHCYDLTNLLTVGKNTITVRVDNSVKDVDPGMNAHSISDHTQSNWNGIAGEMSLRAFSKVNVENIQVYPNIKDGTVLVKAQLKNQTGNVCDGELKIEVTPERTNSDTKHRSAKKSLSVDGEELVELEFSMDGEFALWDEFHPNLYKMTVSLKTDEGTHCKEITFGMRDFQADGTRFAINGRPIFLRGTLECAIFPKTSYPPTDVEEWTRIMKICQAHGLNHVRFHSWCPPEAAFVAADRLGVYLQVETSSWANDGSVVGDGRGLDQWLYEEADRMLRDYGNHPSFCLMSYGNEPAGRGHKEYLASFVDYLKAKDPRHLYNGAAGWPYLENADFYNNAGPRIHAWRADLNCVLNREAPQTMFDFSEKVQATPMPYVSHEIGQWCAYPNFKEKEKYTGVLKAKNFEIFEETLGENHMGHLADSFLLASGKLQALCYKADIEAALRTKGFAGFQLLDLHDFPGQGTALVGVLDAFWDEKGYITAEEYSRFCNQTVPLVRFPKRVYYNTETLKAQVEVAHFGAEPLKDCAADWSLLSLGGEVLANGSFPAATIPVDNGTVLGELSIPLQKVAKAQKLVLTVDVAGYNNSWDVWVYPEAKVQLAISNQPKIVRKLDKQTVEFLQQGGTVLLTPKKGSVKADKGGDIAIGFSSIFWNTAWTRGQKPHTLGILCNPNHKALADFPTEYHSNWQWWDAMSHSNAIVLDDFTPELSPVVQVIDDWFTNRRLALLFEAKVGKGKLMVSGIDLLSDAANRPEAQQLLYSVQKYMQGADFNPTIALEATEIQQLFN